MYVLQEPCNVPYISYGGSDYIERLEAVIACFSFSSVFQRYIQGDKKSILAIKFTKDNGRAYYQIFQIIKSDP